MTKPILSEISVGHVDLAMIDRQVPRSERPDTPGEWLTVVAIAVAVFMALVLL